MLDPGIIHPGAGTSLEGSRWPPCHSFPWHQRAPQHAEIPKTPSWKHGSWKLFLLVDAAGAGGGFPGNKSLPKFQLLRGKIRFLIPSWCGNTPWDEFNFHGNCPLVQTGNLGLLGHQNSFWQNFLIFISAGSPKKSPFRDRAFLGNGLMKSTFPGPVPSFSCPFPKGFYHPGALSGLSDERREIWRSRGVKFPGLG